MELLHCWTHLRSLGGVQTVLRRHLQRDPLAGIKSSAVIFFEREPKIELPPSTRITSLGLRWYHSGRILRRRFARDSGVRDGVGKCCVYHDLWALPTLADLDSAGRRIGLLHGHRGGAAELLRRCDGLLDGILCVSEATAALARDCLPSLSRERVRWIPYPLDAPVGMPHRSSRPGNELVLGFSGRIQSPQKRVERLPEIARELKTAGVPHRWEFLGDGPARDSLVKQFSAAGISVRFHGIQTGEDYWKTLAGWDAVVFASDHEGLPIALLEALSQGVVPLVPNVDNGGRDYARKVAAELIYPPADARGAAFALQWLHGQHLETRHMLSARAQDAVALHRDDAYDRTFRSFVSLLATEPRLSAGGAQARRPHWGEWFPLGLLGRLPSAHPLRRGYV